MPAKKEGFNRVLDGLKKRQLQHDFKLERAAETYEPIQNIGSGAFGIVCEAVETSSDYKVAIKKVAHASATPTLARRTLREIRVLRYIDHPNIVTLRDIFRTQGPLGIDVFLVMDLMQNNLHHIIYGNEEPLDEYYINQFLGQLLRGLEYLHVASIAHRDLKPSNLLVNQDGTLRIADFGMAKFTDNSSKKHDDEEHCYYMTQHVATLPYRAPELLFVLPEHSTAVDMWAVGCIFGEMVTRNELLPGRSVPGQIKMLLTMLGHPPQHVIDEIRCDRTRKVIQDYRSKADAEWDDIMYCKARGDNQIVRGHCDTIDFVKQLFQYDATKRISIQEALKHPYIQRVVEPMDAQKKCPFRVKRDMMQVEDLSHQDLVKLMMQDVRSAENTYNEMRSGVCFLPLTHTNQFLFTTDYNNWIAGDFQRERKYEIENAKYERAPQTNGFNGEQQLGHVSGYKWRIPSYCAA
ncbi:CBN-SMA-5 protein [Caenorhabditis brenneri]|uniref:CBN-SMA-5 protein n=1 Tax=Caenorhabditis brenneri TaxID=135651 RepID=G0MGS4_CAEBE|nr:CBN-SMA-5 protein [Caenorhabditis brenneri]